MLAGLREIGIFGFKYRAIYSENKCVRRNAYITAVTAMTGGEDVFTYYQRRNEKIELG